MQRGPPFEVFCIGVERCVDVSFQRATFPHFDEQHSDSVRKAYSSHTFSRNHAAKHDRHTGNPVTICVRGRFELPIPRRVFVVRFDQRTGRKHQRRTAEPVLCFVDVGFHVEQHVDNFS